MEQHELLVNHVADWLGRVFRSCLAYDCPLQVEACELTNGLQWMPGRRSICNRTSSGPPPLRPNVGRSSGTIPKYREIYTRLPIKLWQIEAMKRLSRAFSCWESFVEQSGGFVAAIAGLGFVCTLGVLPFEQAAPVLMAAVAVTGGLSSLCFSFATPDAGEQDRLAGRCPGRKLLDRPLVCLQR